MEKVTVDQLVGRVFDLLGDKMKSRGDTLEARLKYSKRKLPKKVRLAVEAMAQAETMSQSPNMLMKLDPEDVTRAYQICSDYLEPIDGANERFHRRYKFWAGLLFNLLVGAALLYAAYIVISGQGE